MSLERDTISMEAFNSEIVSDFARLMYKFEVMMDWYQEFVAKIKSEVRTVRKLQDEEDAKLNFLCMIFNKWYRAFYVVSNEYCSLVDGKCSRLLTRDTTIEDKYSSSINNGVVVHTCCLRTLTELVGKTVNVDVSLETLLYHIWLI